MLRVSDVGIEKTVFDISIHSEWNDMSKMSLDARKPVFRVCEQQSLGAEQPAHSRSLISAFVIHLLECIESKLTTSKLSLF